MIKTHVFMNFDDFIINLSTSNVNIFNNYIELEDFKTNSVIPELCLIESAHQINMKIHLNFLTFLTVVLFLNSNKKITVDRKKWLD